MDESTRQQRRAARTRVASYHEQELAKLLDHIADALRRYRAGELEAFEVDDVIYRYKRAARELWKFCWLGKRIERRVRRTHPRLVEG